MIVIDMDMPKSCDECAFFDGEDMCYADGTFALSQSAFENRPKWCPIKCDVEDIKAEIDELEVENITCYYETNKLGDCTVICKDEVLAIIDKLTKGVTDADSN